MNNSTPIDKIDKTRIYRYFGELMKEFFDNGTPIFYRVHISNIKTLLQEILDYYKYTGETKDFNQENLQQLLEELDNVIDNDIILKNRYDNRFNYFSLYIKNILKLKKEKFNILELIIRIEPILQNLNSTYFKEIKKYLNEVLNNDGNYKLENFTTIKKIAFALSTEIFRSGYSKHYIFDNIYKYLLNEEFLKNFNTDNLSIFLNSFSNKEEEFTILIKTYSNKPEIFSVLKENFPNINIYNLLPNKEININDSKKHYIKDIFKKFKENNNNNNYIEIKINSLDYDKASKLAIEEIYNIFSVLKLEYPKDKISISSPNVLCINQETKAIFFPTIETQIDGYKKPSSSYKFKQKLESYQKIQESSYIDNSTKIKIKTSLKFYKYFKESQSLEHKFLNLWIGWENLFSLQNSSKSSWSNIHTFFPEIHSIDSLNKLFIDVINVQYIRKIHNKREESIKYLENNYISNKNKYKSANLYEILRNEKKFEAFKSNINVFEFDDLFGVKIFRLQQITKNPKKFIKSQKNRIQWNLFRMYRIRNMIIHQGVTNSYGIPLEDLVAMLESFYFDSLEYIINKLSINNRFKNIEQLFNTLSETYKFITSKEKLRDIKDSKNIKNIILQPNLIF